MLHIVVERGHIEVCEHLRGEIPDRESAVFGRMEQALAVRQSVPVAAAAFYHAVLRRVQQGRGLGQIFYGLQVTSGVMLVDESLKTRKSRDGLPETS